MRVKLIIREIYGMEHLSSFIRSRKSETHTTALNISSTEVSEIRKYTPPNATPVYKRGR